MVSTMTREQRRRMPLTPLEKFISELNIHKYEYLHIKTDNDTFYLPTTNDKYNIFYLFSGHELIEHGIYPKVELLEYIKQEYPVALEIVYHKGKNIFDINRKEV